MHLRVPFRVPFSTVHCTVYAHVRYYGTDAGGACALAEERDSRGIAAEARDVACDPAHCLQLVERSCVALSAIHSCAHTRTHIITAHNKNHKPHLTMSSVGSPAATCSCPVVN